MRKIRVFQEYNVDLGQLYNWLPWGGLIYPQVVRNKDGSLMGFIRYSGDTAKGAPYGHPTDEVEGLEFTKGWAVWSECWHYDGRNELTLTLCWNPFRDKNSGLIVNGMTDGGLSPQLAELHFQEILTQLCQVLSEVECEAHILQNEEVLQYLAQTLTGEPSSQEMYVPPLYLDAVLSRDVRFQVYGAGTEKKNDLAIGGRDLTVVTPLGQSKVSVMYTLFEAFADLDYRFVRRFLFCDEAGAEKSLDGYMSSWCKGRSTLKAFMRGQLLGELNGLFAETFIFRFAEEERDEREAQVESAFRSLGLPHVFENYNRKHCWWGTLPGCFRANIPPQVTGLDSLAELLIGGEQPVQAESL